MSSSAALRQQIESDFQHRYPSVLTPSARTIREVASTGIPELDELLNGGLPVGAISELTGPVSSGRTSIVMSFLANRTQEECVCGWIDANDSFDPESAASNGISLNHLLWVRCTNLQSSNLENPTQKFGNKKAQPWTRLDQTIRATDLLLQSGGFVAIVLDLGDESVDHGRRIPLATWFRFRQAADRTRCSLIVLGKASYAQSSAAVVLECQQGAIDAANHTVISAFNFNARRRRERFSPLASIDRRPPASAWSAQMAWNTEIRA